MDFTSPLFDRIRVKPAKNAPEKPKTKIPCSHPGCSEEGVFRAPKGRDREGEYFTFCKDHVREYNATYDYFKGMDDESMAKFRQADAIGHRPTWKLGDRAAASHVDETVFAEARASRRRGLKGRAPATEPAPPRYNALALKALMALELDGTATQTRIKSRYKDLVKRHHPDANGGDRSSEDKLREIIQAYNFLRANKLV